MADERDPKVSGRYRQLPSEEPSRELDQAILAAAHRAADRPHAPLVAPAGRHRWYYSLAAAAIIVLAVAVTLHIEQQPPDAELNVPVGPASVQNQEKPASPPASPAEQSRRDSTVRKERRPAFTPEPAPATDAVAGRADESHLAAEKAHAEQAKRAVTAPMAAQSAAPSPERELERIAELRRQGRDDEADKALAEFRKRYPDYEIAPQMRAKVERSPAR